MNLFERSEQLAGDVVEINALRAVANQAEAIRSRASQFEKVLAALRLSSGSARLLHDQGVNVEFRLEAQGVRHFLKELHGKVADDPAAVLAVKDISPKMLKPIERDSAAIREAADKAWGNYVRKHMSGVSNELLEGLSRVPKLRSKVERLQSLKYQALRRGERAPSSAAEFDLIRKLGRQFYQAWQELDAQDMPKEVLNLFREAATVQGAALSSLTPKVLAWLNSHGLTDTLGDSCQVSLGDKHDVVMNAIEGVEMLSLRWGDVDGSLGREELVDIAARSVDATHAEEIVENLIDAALIHAFDVPGGGERYRTRFAETMRLLARARQIFRGESWRGAPPLVADFRVDLRPRRYPRRDRDSEKALGAHARLSDVQREVWRAIAPASLSHFQEDATARLLAQHTEDDGTIITAGTGSGKTWAFYLPVLVRIAELAKSGEFWTKAIAIYPRNELLKDQLTQAYRTVRKANAVLNQPRCRPLRVAAYFGNTPMSAHERGLHGWRKVPGPSDAFVCPFLRCDCDGELLWTTEDLNQGRERLVCASGCGHSFEEKTLPLTRRSIQRHPPDILFTTTETLNRSLSNQYSRQLFGVRMPRARRPKFLLLDEAHTYNGVAGAQAAITLRRWRTLSGGPVRWVGLSATLEKAQDFFAYLTGLPPHRVAQVTPANGDMVHEGGEYQVALRGDPASRTSLLSTSIQACMLLARIMDPSSRPSEGRFGGRLFAFTDDLDVTHRLYDDLRDAEGYDAFGRFQPTRGTLAALRNVTRHDGNARERENDGQVWRLPEEIGHDLSEPLVVARTTARDPGVNREANVIVATSALEVGFNDPDVGAILQHKAPRSFASFLQRRGRAGRERRMRPLTVTVLSDYGRDRQLFQSFEHLFDPMLAAQSLPIRNQYVLRMQAAFALLDWMADRPRPAGTPAGACLADSFGSKQCKVQGSEVPQASAEAIVIVDSR